MPKPTGNYIIRWSDISGKKHKKLYSDYDTVIKARGWLFKNGTKDVDISIEIR